VGVFSTLKSHHRFTFAAMLDTRFPSPEEKFTDFIQVYEALVEEGFSRGTYTYIAAMVVITEEGNSAELASRAMNVYKEMRQNHFFLTGQSDYPLAMLLAQREQNTAAIVDHIESLYEKLNQSGFYKGNDLQTMSHILSLVEDVSLDELVTRSTELFDTLKEEGIRPKSRFYPQIAMLAFMKNGKEQITQVKEILESLNSDKLFKWQKDINFMMAVTLHLSDQMENSSLLHTNLSTTIEALIQAQQAASVAAIAGAAAATSSGE
ncbi:DUF4003 domain-containing protein, partial [Bacillus haikouensis]|uniref:DUF4003 family protein n=1 Tax=Bacillus haikouensis TaxID=1510468 RepID=UPI0015567194